MQWKEYKSIEKSLKPAIHLKSRPKHNCSWKMFLQEQKQENEQ